MTSCIDRLSRAPRLNLAALALAALALFVALGGTSYAAGILIGTEQIEPNAVTSGKIRNNHVSSADLRNNGVRSADVADASIAMNDLTGRLQAMVTQGVSGMIDTGGLANGSVTNPKLGTSSVSSSKVAPNTLTSGDLHTSSVGRSEIATGAAAGAEVAGNAIQGDEIDNGSLNAADVGEVSGSADRNFPPIAPGSCEIVWIDPPGPQSFHNSAVVVTPSVGFGGNVSLHVEGGGSLRLKACNPSGAPIDPDGTGTNYNYIAFG